MISRRILRIKALLAFYAYDRRGDGDIAKAEKELIFSINKTYELYHSTLLLLLEIKNVARERMELALQKRMPTEDDLNPNRKFVDNRLLKVLENNNHRAKYLAESKITWINHADVPKALYQRLVEMPQYKEYLNSTDNTFSSDRSFIIWILRNLLLESEELSSSLEEQSIYWNDDLPFVIAMLEKSIKKINAGSSPDHPLMPLYSNIEDEVFVKELIRKAIMSFELTAGLVEQNTTNWEIERIALMDRLVMQLAISEMLAFDEIPVKVTLNEYIDITKYYCTSKSNTFVNGILDKVVKVLEKDSRMVKSGRGLIVVSPSQAVKSENKSKK